MSDINLKLRHAKRQNSQKLDLSNHCIENVPEEMYHLKSLLTLNLSNNKICEINKLIENLLNLSELNLENNNITMLPIEILQLPNLLNLNLNNNPICFKLKDFNLNWKLSLKEFFANGNSNPDSTNNQNSKDNSSHTGFIHNNKLDPISLVAKDRIQSAYLTKNVPFSFSMPKMDGNSLSNNSLRASNIMNANKTMIKKENYNPEQIPNCVLFDSSYVNNNFKAKDTAENDSLPKRLQTGVKNIKIIDKIESKKSIDNIYQNAKDESNAINQNGNHNTNIDELKYNSLDKNKMLDESKEHVESLLLKISKYEEELKIIKFNFSKKEENYNNTIKQLDSEVKSLKEKSDNNQTEKKADKIIHNKRNWMDQDVGTTSNNHLTKSHANMISSNDDKDSKIKELENQLQKEIQTTKRMKNEIDRINKQMTENKLSLRSSDDLIKNVTEINYDDIQIENKVGQGGFSMIYKANWKMLPIALKVIFDPNVTEDLLNEFNNEIKMLYLLRHPNIILLLGICTKPQKLSIITEYIECGSLFDTLHRSNKEINYQTKLKIISQLIRTFAFIHQNGIVHRDIKSHNVLVDENFNVKICDFGLAKNISELNWGNGQFSGTPAYMAPELLLKKAYDEKIDIFSCGTLLWEILVRKIPFEGFELGDIKNRTLSEEKFYLPKTIPADWANLINSCRSLDPNKRPSFTDLININYYNYK